MEALIPFHLLSGTMRFNQLRRHIEKVTQRTLTNQSRELEEDGLIARKVYAQVPPRGEYSLSPLGRSLEPILLALKAWGAMRISGSMASRDDKWLRNWKRPDTTPADALWAKSRHSTKQTL